VAAHTARPSGNSHQDAIKVVNPKALGADSLPAERIPIGVTGDYKPCIALLGNGELAVVAFHPNDMGGGRTLEDMIWFTSRDGGRTWPERRVIGLLGREPYFSVLRDGTLFITTHLLEQDVRNTDGYVHCYLHRSTDNGKTWETLKISREEVPAAPEESCTRTNRNVLELNDGTIVFGVGASCRPDYLWRSKDGGKTWDKTQTSNFRMPGKDEQSHPSIEEAVYWQAPCGDLLAILRVDQKLFPPLPGTEIPQETLDHFQRMVVYRSKDGGSNWFMEEEWGSYYGEMYPAVLRLQDGRLLLTFTVRAVRPPLGVQAVLGEEKPDGFSFDFENDRLVIDAKTLLDMTSGGGFGPTVQLPDSALVTAYSYRTADDKTHLEVARWRLPEAKSP